MPIRLWTKEEDKIIIDKYPIDGTNISKLLNRSNKAVINRASKLKVRLNLKKKYCTKCNKEINPYQKSTLCKNCSAKKIYHNRGAFSHNNSKLWTDNEINFLCDNYHNLEKDKIIKNLNRNWASITHKANRLGLVRNLKFIEEGNRLGREYFKKNNPMLNELIRNKVKKKLKQGYREGKIKISGIALKSSMGLTKKENHPNWLGGKSFEPYDSRFDKSFCRLIRDRDKFCMICHQLDNKNLCVHHVDYNKKNTSIENCIALCNSCHMKTNYNRSSWIKFFQILLSDRYGYDYGNY